MLRLFYKERAKKSTQMVKKQVSVSTDHAIPQFGSGYEGYLSRVYMTPEAYIKAHVEKKTANCKLSTGCIQRMVEPSDQWNPVILKIVGLQASIPGCTRKKLVVTDGKVARAGNFILAQQTEPLHHLIKPGLFIRLNQYSITNLEILHMDRTVEYKAVAVITDFTILA